MKYSLMSLMVDEELHHKKANFMLRTMLSGVGEACPEDADEAYELLNRHGIPVHNGKATFEDMVRFAKENGFDGLDLMSYQMELEPKEIRGIMEKHRMVLSAVNIIMPFSEAFCEEIFQGMLGAAKQEIDRAAEAGAEQILLVPGGYVRSENMTREQTFRTMIRGLGECVAYAREKGVPVTTETLESVSVPWSSLGEMQRVFDALPDLGYTHDTGNPLVANEDPLALCRCFWDRVKSVHFKDLGDTAPGENTYRTMDGSHLMRVPFGTGRVDFPAHLKLLLEKGYDGYITIEGGIPGKDKWEEAKNALAYFKAMEQQITEAML